MRNTFLLLIGMVLAVTSSFAQTTQPTTSTTQSVGSRAVTVTLDGTIDEFNYTMLKRRFEQAREAGANVVILEINTYGGLVTAGLDISRFLKRQDDLRVIALVDEKAISAGAMIALACDEIVMEPASLIGDSGVIAMGQTIEGETERAKIESPVLADFEDSARRNGHDPLLATAMVQTIRVVHFIENIETSERRFVDAIDYERLVTTPGEEAKWKPVEGVQNPLDKADTLLTLSDETALTVGLSKGTFPSAQAFAEARGLTIVKELTPSGGERIVGFLASGVFRGAMIAALMFAIYAGVKIPGTGIAEAGILVALALLLGVPWLTGYAQWYEIFLVLAGVVLIAVEIFVLPGFGVAGITGIIFLLGGLTMTFLPPLVVPDMPAFTGVSLDALRSALTAVVGGMVASLFLWLWLGRYLPKLPYVNKLILTATTASAASVPADIAMENNWPTLGLLGVAQTDLRPGGTGRFNNREGFGVNVDVVSDRGFINAGTGIVVSEIHGSKVVVRPA